MKRYSLNSILVLLCLTVMRCGFFEDKVNNEEGRASFTSDVTKTIPGLLSATLLQTITVNFRGDTLDISNQLMIENITSNSISGASYVLQVFNEESRAEDNLVIDHHCELGTLEAFDSGDAVKIDSQFGGEISDNKIRFALTKSGNSNNDHSLSGVYIGSYELIEGTEVQSNHSVKGYVDYTGELNFFLTHGSPINQLDGIVFRDSSFRGTAYLDGEIVDQNVSGSFMEVDDRLQANLAFETNADLTLTLPLTKETQSCK